MDTETAPRLILSDEEVDVLNRAREILDSYGQRCIQKSWSTPMGWNDGHANAGDFARVAAKADTAAYTLFDLLNSTSSYHVRELDYRQLHNREPEPDEDAENSAYGPGNPDWEHDRERETTR